MVEDWWDHMNERMDGSMHGAMGGGAWWGIGWLLLLLVVVALAVVVVVAVLAPGRHPHVAAGSPLPTQPPATQPPGPSPDAAEALLRERYARGEIDQTEFDARLARLRTSR